MTIYDQDYVNQMMREERQQLKEERELKNRILAMPAGPRKTAMWQKHFPPVEKYHSEWR